MREAEPFLRAGCNSPAKQHGQLSTVKDLAMEVQVKKLFARLGKGGTLALIMSFIAIGALAWGLFLATSTATITMSGGMAANIDMGPISCLLEGNGVLTECSDDGSGAFTLIVDDADDTTNVEISFLSAANNGSAPAFITVTGQDDVPEIPTTVNLNGSTWLPGASVSPGAFTMLFKFQPVYGSPLPLAVYSWPAIDLVISDS